MIHAAECKLSEKTETHFLTRISQAALLILLGLLCFHIWHGPDIAYHLALGRAILEQKTISPSSTLLMKQPSYVNIYWFFQLITWFFFSVGGMWGIFFEFLLVRLGIGFLWWKMIRPGATAAYVCFAGLICLLIFQVRFEQRPELFSYLFLSVQVFLLNRWSPQRSFTRAELILLAMVSWVSTNSHGYFILGVGAVGLRLLCELPRIHKDLAIALGLTVLATVLGPLGLKTWQNSWNMFWFFSEARAEIFEFFPVTFFVGKLWTVTLFLVFWMVVLGVSLFQIFRRRFKFEPLLALTGCLIGYQALRNIPANLVFAMPLLGQVLKSKALNSLTPYNQRRLEISSTILCIALSFWVVSEGFYESLVSHTGFGVTPSSATFPVYTEKYLKEIGFKGRLFNDPASGCYLELFQPGIELYADSRFVEAPIVKEYFAARKNHEVFQKLEQRYHFDGVILETADDSALVVELLRDPNWVLAFGELSHAFFLKKEIALQHPSWIRTPEYFNGQDLKRRVYGRSAIMWADHWIKLKRTDDLLAFLKKMDQAPTIPSVLVEFALRYAIQEKQAEVMLQALKLKPKVYALQKEDQVEVQDLMDFTEPLIR